MHVVSEIHTANNTVHIQQPIANVNTYPLIVPSVHMSQAQKMGYGRYVAVYVWLSKGDMLVTLADAQASQHDSAVHAQRFFPPK